jgi:hypothetical protein
MQLNCTKFNYKLSDLRRRWGSVQHFNDGLAAMNPQARGIIVSLSRGLINVHEGREGVESKFVASLRVHSSPCDPNFTFKVTKAKHDKIQWECKKWMKFRNKLAPLSSASVSMSSGPCFFFFTSLFFSPSTLRSVAFRGANRVRAKRD